MTKAQLIDKLDKGYEGGSRLMQQMIDLKVEHADLKRDKADRDHLIFELACELERLVEVMQPGIDCKPALRLYNRAQDLVGWEDDQ